MFVVSDICPRSKFHDISAEIVVKAAILFLAIFIIPPWNLAEDHIFLI